MKKSNYIINSDVVSKNINGEEVILNLATGTYFGLNHSGSVIWNCLEKKMSVKEISENLVLEFDVSLDKAQEDIFELINKLKESKLIELV